MVWQFFLPYFLLLYYHWPSFIPFPIGVAFESLRIRCTWFAFRMQMKIHMYIERDLNFGRTQFSRANECDDHAVRRRGRGFKTSGKIRRDTLSVRVLRVHNVDEGTPAAAVVYFGTHKHKSKHFLMRRRNAGGEKDKGSSDPPLQIGKVRRGQKRWGMLMGRCWLPYLIGSCCQRKS